MFLYYINNTYICGNGLTYIIMVLTIKEYAEKYTHKGVILSDKSIRYRIKCGLLPSNHLPKKLSGIRGAWIIEVVEK